VKKELFRIPLLGKAMRMASFVPVDRSNREAAIASIQRATEVMRSGVNITVFPEGTRSSDGRLLPFKKGPFHLAMESGIPVVPMTIFGTEKMMPKKTWKITKGTATLIFHPPMQPRDFNDREHLMEAVREKIASALPAEMK
jgi:1-acyl-sn-glycerol-3-phosphate acyltransferase